MGSGGRSDGHYMMMRIYYKISFMDVIVFKMYAEKIKKHINKSDLICAKELKGMYSYCSFQKTLSP